MKRNNLILQISIVNYSLHLSFLNIFIKLNYTKSNTIAGYNYLISNNSVHAICKGFDIIIFSFGMKN